MAVSPLPPSQPAPGPQPPAPQPAAPGPQPAIQGPPDVIAAMVARYGDQTHHEPVGDKVKPQDGFKGDAPLSAGFEPNWFKDVPEPPPESQAIWKRITSTYLSPQENRSAMRELAASPKLLAMQSPEDMEMLIVHLSQVMEMEPADEKAIAQVVQFAAGQKKLGEVSEELLAEEKFYAIYNRLSSATKQVVAPLFASQLPGFFPSDELNAATYKRMDAMKAAGELGKAPYDVIIVPGYTPLGATRPTPLTPEARARLQTAVDDFKAGKAPFIMVSGAAVHPESSRINEAKVMRDCLVEDFGIPADRILVEGLARHSTTNLRNAGRMMLDHGLNKGLIVSDPGFMGMVSQSDYFSMIFFNLRYQNNHGQWGPGEIQPVDDNPLGIGDKRNLFIPDPGVQKRDVVNDPLDP
ncbi:MAG: YdcF family protein [Candidatus Sericytochromatia bacterium]